MKIDSMFLQTLANIFDNLSAGWFGAAIIFPAFSDKTLNLNVWLLLLDILFGILFMLLAYRLRIKKRRRKGKI